ncbi:MAG: LCP family protein [Verrucomicrobia bacterium]|nr:LCP family protein [Verrucomicrobiota bacterium]
MKHRRGGIVRVFPRMGRRILLWALFLAAAGSFAGWRVTAGWRQPITLLILVSDTRRDSAPGRSDTIFVLRADPRDRSLRGLSLPRDLYVPIRGLPTLLTNRINTALFYGDYYRVPGGGRRAARETVSRLLNVPIDGVMVLGFPIVQDVVDSIGGVEVYVENLVVDRSFQYMTGGRSYTLRFEPGWNYLDGRRALDFVRLRRPDTDFGRMDRNRRLFEALRGNVKGPAGFWPLVRLLPRTARRLKSDMTFGQKLRSAWVFYRCADGPIQWHTLAREDVEPAVTPQGAQVLLPDPEALAQAGQWLLDTPRAYAEKRDATEKGLWTRSP